MYHRLKCKSLKTFWVSKFRLSDLRLNIKSTIHNRNILVNWKRQATEWKKIFSCCILVSRIFKIHLKLNYKKQNIHLESAKGIWCHFTKEDMQWQIRHMKTHSTPLAARKMQIRVTM
jgi:hypothetical protein